MAIEAVYKRMEQEYSIWEFGSRVSLSLGLAIVLLFIVEIGAEMGALGAEHQTLAFMAGGAFLLYGVIPTIQHVTAASANIARSYLSGQPA